MPTEPTVEQLKAKFNKMTDDSSPTYKSVDFSYEANELGAKGLYAVPKGAKESLKKMGLNVEFNFDRKKGIVGVMVYDVPVSDIDDERAVRADMGELISKYLLNPASMADWDTEQMLAGCFVDPYEKPSKEDIFNQARSERDAERVTEIPTARLASEVQKVEANLGPSEEIVMMEEEQTVSEDPAMKVIRDKMGGQ